MNTRLMIPIDFVTGSHGNYLESICNQEFGIVAPENNFTPIGTSHVKSISYDREKLFDARHWSNNFKHLIHKYPVIVSIRFTVDDLLLLSSISLLRAGDSKIDNNLLQENTVSKLSNSFYQTLVTEIKNAYPFVNLESDSIPRHVLREYFKFGFKDPEQNGLWAKQKQMVYGPDQHVLPINFSSFYNIDTLMSELTQLAYNLDFEFKPSQRFFQNYKTFLKFNPYITHKAQCDEIVTAITQQEYINIPKLSLFQESYINSRLENLYHKEMPFHQDEYFNSTKDVLYYIEHLAPTL